MQQHAKPCVGQPVTREHRQAMRWFSSLASVAKDNPNMQHSVQFYSLFAMTGEREFLERCEDFLKHGLQGR